MFHRSWSIVPSRADRVGCSEAYSQSPYQLNHRSRRCISRSVARGRALYQSCHLSRSVALSVDPSLAVGRCISRSIAHCRPLYQSFHCSRWGVVSFAAGRCISCSIACSQSSYPSLHRLQFVVASVSRRSGSQRYIRCSIRIANGQSLCTGRSIARGQLLCH